MFVLSISMYFFCVCKSFQGYCCTCVCNNCGIKNIGTMVIYSLKLLKITKQMYYQMSKKTSCLSGWLLISKIKNSKPMNLSFIKMMPDEITNETPVIICHGFLGSKQNWKSLAKSIALKSGRQVYVLDARNHGDSPHSDHFSINLMCEDVKHFMFSQSIPSAVIVGHSMGGRTAMKMSLTKEHLVNKLVVVDVSPTRMPENSYVSISSYMAAMKEAIIPFQNLGIIEARKVVNEHLAQSIPDVSIRQFLLTNLTEKDNKITWKANIDVLQKTFKPEICDFSGFSGCYLGDTVFICGADSPYVRQEDYSAIKKLFPKAEFFVIPGAGHWVHSEKPSEFLTVLCNFL